MARSPLTLAASVTSALPRAGVVGVAELTERAAGRYDAAVATLDDGRRVVVRIPVDAEADSDLRAEVRALRALTPGVRAVLPFTAPDVLGHAPFGSGASAVQTVVQSFVSGYRVDAAHIPAGPGVATSLAHALAAVHDLPSSVVRDAGLPVLAATQVRDEAERLLDRAEATQQLPFGLLRRWSTALGTDALWRFETTVTLGGVEPAAFTLEDVEGVPTVVGLLTWGGLSVGDPAADLRWVASAVAAHDDILDAYADRAHRAPDALLPQRARLHAELEFAKWLVHAHEGGNEAVVADAVALLESLEISVRDEPPLAQETVTLDDAMAVLGRVSGNTDAIDTSMQTDAFDPGTDLAFLAAETATGDVDAAPVDIDAIPPRRPEAANEETMPIEPVLLTDWAPQRATSGAAPGATSDAEGDDADEPDRAARNALRRWTGTA